MRPIRTCLGRVASGAVHDPGEGSSNAGWPRWHRRSCSAPQQPRTHASTCTRTQQCAWAAHQSLSDQSRSRFLISDLLAMGRYGPGVTYTVPHKATINAPPPVGPLGGLMGDPGASFSKYPRGVQCTISKGGFDTQGQESLNPQCYTN